MKREYFAVLWEDWLVETSGETLKQLKERLNYYMKTNPYPSTLKDYTICEYVWDNKKYEVNYYLDREIYVLDREADELVEYDDYKEHGIKFRIIPKDFLYLKTK